MKLFALMVASLVVLWARPTEACSCMRGSEGLAEALRGSRDDAEVIFRARAVAVGPRWPLLALFGARTGLEATLEVHEVFKGEVGPRVVFDSGDLSGMCDYPFQAGREYVVYASLWEGKLSTSFCDRTRPVDTDDAELTWLRTGVLPPLPRALKRESVQCEPCESDKVARRLTGVSEGQSAYGSPEGAQWLLAAGRPVWVKRYSGPVRAAGVAADGRAFELVQTPGYDTWERCRQRVQRRWCARVEAFRGAEEEFSLRCVEPGPAEEVCDERKTRASSWGRVEAVGAASCHWETADRTTCELKTVQVLPASGPATPLLACSPAYAYSDRYHCSVQAGSTGK